MVNFLVCWCVGVVKVEFDVVLQHLAFIYLFNPINI